jgi:hypothetical protein
MKKRVGSRKVRNRVATVNDFSHPMSLKVDSMSAENKRQIAAMEGQGDRLFRVKGGNGKGRGKR